MGSEPSDRYYMHLPVWASGNLYCNGAKAREKEQDAIVCPERDIFVRAVEQPDGSDIVFDEDILGEKRTIKTVAGPFANWGKAIRLVY